MKRRLVIFGAFASLLLPDLAFAQPGQRPGPGDNRPGKGPGNGANRPGPDRPGSGHQGSGHPGSGQRPPQTRPPAQKPPQNRPPQHRPPQHRPPQHRPPQNRPGRPPQFTWRGRNFNRFHGPAFRYPSGYSYRRWSVGASLPALFLSSLYYFTDWNTLGVGRPPPGRRWVRYGPDLLLVNVRTRRVEDVIYGVFY